MDVSEIVERVRIGLPYPMVGTDQLLALCKVAETAEVVRYASYGDDDALDAMYAALDDLAALWQTEGDEE